MDQIVGQEAISMLIAKYRETPLLWDSRHPLYKSRARRRTALADIATYMQTWVPDCTGNMVKNKLNNLRAAFRTKRRQLRAQRSGAAARQSTEPSLWYYQEMEFLGDQMDGRRSMSSLPPRQQGSRPSTDHPRQEENSEGLAGMRPELRLSTSSDEEEETSLDLTATEPEMHGSQEEGVIASQEEEAGPSTSQEGPRPRASTSPHVPPPQVRQAGLMRRRREVEDRSLEMIREASAIMRAPLTRTEAYSAYVAHELATGGEEDQRRARNLFNQVILWMQRGWLTDDTEISDPAHPAQHLLPPPAATSSPSARGHFRIRGRSAARRVRRNRRR